MKHFLTLLLFLSGLAVWVPVSGDTQTGVNALGRGEYEKALAAFRPGAEQGNPADQNFLAYTYVRLENYEEAYAWYHLSAACGSIDAEIELEILSKKISVETAAAARVATTAPPSCTKRSTIALPIPREPPVTIAVLPVSRPISEYPITSESSAYLSIVGG